MIDSRLPWLSVGASRTDLESASSLSLLHSIYGSQVSQLPFSEDSETSLVEAHSDLLTSSTPPRHHRVRPKSSPAASLAVREQQKRVQRPGSALHRPGSALGSRPRRPASSRPGQRRPSSAYQGRGGSRHRPRTAGSQRPPPSLVVEDLEGRPLPKDTAPVQVTTVPEYFNFWEGKPLLERDFSVRVQKRKPWRRPKSDYGSRYSSGLEDGNCVGAGRRGWGETEGGGVLETVVERDSAAGSEYGSGDGHGWRGRQPDLEDGEIGGQLSGGVGGESQADSDATGSVGHDDGHSHKESRRGSKGNRGGGLDGSGNGRRTKKSAWGAGDGSDKAEEDDYFRKNAAGPGLLPPILSSASLCTFNDSLLPKLNDAADSLPKLNEAAVQETKVFSASAETFRENGVVWQAPGVVSSSPDQHEGEHRLSGQQPSRLPAIRAQPLGASSPKKAMAATSWLDVGNSSHRCTRFELPMDVKNLEGMSPLQYLRNHCIISDRRMEHCSKVFTKLDTDKDSRLNAEEVAAGLVEVHYHCITADQASHVLELVQWPLHLRADLKLFAALCCLAERMFSVHFLPFARREVIETVDFEALEWKLRNCRIGPPLKTLFTQL